MRGCRFQSGVSNEGFELWSIQHCAYGFVGVRRGVGSKRSSYGCRLIASSAQPARFRTMLTSILPCRLTIISAEAERMTDMKVSDFRLPSLRAQHAGVNVLAAASGRVLRVRDGVPDISVRDHEVGAVNGRECGNGVVIDHGEGWSTQYCHMAQRSLLVKPGDKVEASQPLGRVGLSGMTEYPHLHFAVTFQGKLVEPFAFGASEGSCGGGRSLWQPSLQSALAYKPRAVLNVGFANGEVKMQAIEAGDVPAPTLETPLVAYVRAIGTKAGDIQKLQVVTPDGRILVERSTEPLNRDKAQVMMFVGKKPPAGGWPRGVYRATYTIRHDNTVVLDRSFTIEL